MIFAVFFMCNMTAHIVYFFVTSAVFSPSIQITELQLWIPLPLFAVLPGIFQLRLTLSLLLHSDLKSVDGLFIHSNLLFPA